MNSSLNSCSSPGNSDIEGDEEEEVVVDDEAWEEEDEENICEEILDENTEINGGCGSDVENM